VCFVGIILLLVKHIILTACLKAITDCPAFDNTAFFNASINNKSRYVIAPLVRVENMNECV